MKKPIVTVLIVLIVSTMVGIITYQKTKNYYELSLEDKMIIEKNIESFEAIRKNDSITFKNLINGDVKESFFTRSVRNNFQKVSKSQKELIILLEKQIAK